MTTRPIGPRAMLAALVLLVIGAPSAASEGLPTLGQSLGGHWRQGPAVNAPLMGSLPAGRQIQILEKMDDIDNGYHWFKIEVGRQWGYQWGGIMCSNRRQLPGLAAVCDPKERVALGTGSHGFSAIAGQYTTGWGHEDGTANDFCGVWDPQVDLNFLSIDTNPNSIGYYNYDCTVASTEPRATGLHIKGTCTLNAVGAGEVQALTKVDRTLNLLAFQADNGNTLILIDQEGPDRGLVRSYALCNR